MEGMSETTKGEALEGVEIQFTECLHFRIYTEIQTPS